MTTKQTLLIAIRAKCIDCSGGSKREVAKCNAYTCALHAFRFGRDPSPSRTTGFAKTAAQAHDSKRPDDE